MSAQRGQIFRAPAGSWAIRYYEANGRRRQKHGFRTKSEARTALDDALRRVRLGPLHRPNVTLRELVAAYLGQHEAAPSTLVWLRENLRPALDAFGDDAIGSLAGADEYERELLDRFDSGRSEPDGRYLGGEEGADAA